MPHPLHNPHATRPSLCAAPGHRFSVGPARAAVGTFPFNHRTVAEIDEVRLAHVRDGLALIARIVPVS